MRLLGAHRVQPGKKSVIRTEHNEPRLTAEASRAKMQREKKDFMLLVGRKGKQLSSRCRLLGFGQALVRL